MWIRVDASLPDHKKTRVAASRLTRTCPQCEHQDPIGVPQLMGHLVSLWLRCLDQAADGDLEANSSAEDIAFLARWEGDPAAFTAALEDVGFLENGGEGLNIHDWMEYAGSLKAALKKREQRGSKHKKAQRKPKVAGSVPGRSLDSPRTVPDMSPRTDGRTDGHDGRTDVTLSPDSPGTVPGQGDPAPLGLPADPAGDTGEQMIMPDQVEQAAMDEGWKGWMADSSRQMVMELGPITRVEWDAAAAVTKEKAQSPCLAYCLTRIRSARATETRPEVRDDRTGYHPGSKEFGDGEQQI